MSQELTPKQSRTIDALLIAPTQGDAAQMAGVTARTIQRWLEMPTFKRALSEAEGRAIDRAGRRLVMLADKATAAIESVLDNPSQPGAGNKRLAAQAVIDSLLKLREARTTEERLSALEEVVYGENFETDRRSRNARTAYR